MASRIKAFVTFLFWGVGVLCALLSVVAFFATDYTIGLILLIAAWILCSITMGRENPYD